ncbi:unnamed protein product, partial [Laminaria digitata]
MMDNAAQDEKRAAEEKTGVVSRKAAPDGYCYEDRVTKMPVDPDVYKAMYTEHIRATREARVKEFALLRAKVSSPSEAAVGPISGSGNTKKKSPAVSHVTPPPPALRVVGAVRSPENAAAVAALPA